MDLPAPLGYLGPKHTSWFLTTVGIALVNLDSFNNNESASKTYALHFWAIQCVLDPIPISCCL